MPTIDWGSGAECGPGTAIYTIFDWCNIATPYLVVTTPAHTGNYSFAIANFASPPVSQYGKALPTPANEYYVAGWLYAVAATSTPALGFLLSDGKKILISYDYGAVQLIARVDATTVGTFRLPTPYGSTWRHVQAYLKVADTGGRLIVKFDGQVVIDYTGDTKPSTSTTITHGLWGSTYYGDSSRFDDIAMGPEWPGDVRFDVAEVPNEDVSTSWTPSTGTTHYTLLDEMPANTTDYISTAVNGQIDKVGFTDWDGTGKTPVHVNVYAYSKIDTADGQSLVIQADSGGTVVEQAEAPTTTWAMYQFSLNKNPNGNVPWTQAAINALRAGVKSVVP